MDVTVPGELLRPCADGRPHAAVQRAPLRDFGGTTAGLAVVLTAAALWLERRLVVVALLAYLSFSAPHLVFHVGHLHGASGPAASVLVIALVGSVVLPLALLIGVPRQRPAPTASPRGRKDLPSGL